MGQAAPPQSRAVGHRLCRGSGGFLQGLEYVTDTFDRPAQAQQLTTLALLVGLPVVLVTARYHGDQGRQRVSAAELSIIALLFLVGGGIFWRYDQVSGTPSTTAATTPLPATASGASAAAPEKSIAVLPFVNMSGDADNEYFSDGISEEILNVLAQVQDLSVAARSSRCGWCSRAACASRPTAYASRHS